jgi:DNA repair exonuclease SbcCD nuclease subunit
MVYVLPYPSKSWLIGNAGPGNILDQKQTIEAGLRAILDFWRESAVVARREGILTVGLFHISISEAKLAGSEIMIGREIELTPHDLDELGFDAGFLSHIHRAQEVTKNWWYAGAPYRQNHGEESYVPSFTTCFLEVGKPPIWELVRTPTAKLTTIRHGVSATHEDIKGADVRYQADLAEEDRASFNRAMIEKEFMTAGARSVVFDIRTIPKTRVRYEAITKARTNVERFRAYCDSLGRSAPPKDQRERCEEKLNELEGGVDG